MNRRQFWHLRQGHKFLRVEASRDILKFRVSEMAFPGVFKRYFPPETPCCFARIHGRLGTIRVQRKSVLQPAIRASCS